MADEFYPVGHDGKGKTKEQPEDGHSQGPKFPVPCIAIMIANPPYSGPDQIYVSCMHSDAEDYYGEYCLRVVSCSVRDIFFYFV